MPSKNLKLQKIEATFKGPATQTFSVKQKGRTFVRVVHPRTHCCLVMTINTMEECVDRDDANEFFVQFWWQRFDSSDAIRSHSFSGCSKALFACAWKFFLVGRQTKKLMNRLVTFSSGVASS